VSYGDGGREIDPFAKKKGARVGLALATCFKAYATGRSRLDLVKEELGGNKPIEMIVRAATDAADTTTTAWAASLVRESWGEFLELIRDMSVYPRVPGMRAMFDRAGLLTFPRNDGRGTLAGGFFAQGSPIPVKSGSIGEVSLQPMSMGVISSFTKQLAKQSIPSIQTVIQTQMLGDTAETIDTLFLDATARSTTRPAGLQDTTETGAANINAASGTGTVADVITDVNGVLGRVYAARAGTGGVWLMNPLRVLGLINKQDAASGLFPFRDEVLRGTFQGYPILSSQNVTSTIVAFVSDQSMVHAAMDSPTIEVSDQATLHFEDTTPTDIGTAGTPNVVAAPVRSLWQDHLVAVKFFQELDWRIVRIGGVQVLTAVAW
jgi:HK97 family phage major capsid protein